MRLKARARAIQAYIQRYGATPLTIDLILLVVMQLVAQALSIIGVLVGAFALGMRDKAQLAGLEWPVGITFLILYVLFLYLWYRWRRAKLRDARDWAKRCSADIEKGEAHSAPRP